MSDTDALGLGRVGIWSIELWVGDPEEGAQAAAEIDELGYGAVWIPGLMGGPVLDDAERLLEATTTIRVAIGVLNLWMHDPVEVAARHHELRERHGARLVLGVGVSDRPSAEKVGRTFGTPLSAARDYLTALDAAPVPVARDERLLAALGPRMTALAGQETAGAHPFLVTPEACAAMRAILGPEPVLAPHLAVVLDTDATVARDAARRALQLFIGLPPHQRNLRRQGFTDADLVPGGGDALLDRLVTHGTPQDVAARVREYHDAGADHVALQVIATDPAHLPRDAWRALAAELPVAAR